MANTNPRKQTKTDLGLAEIQLELQDYGVELSPAARFDVSEYITKHGKDQVKKAVMGALERYTDGKQLQTTPEVFILESLARYKW